MKDTFEKLLVLAGLAISAYTLFIILQDRKKKGCGCEKKAAPAPAAGVVAAPTSCGVGTFSSPGLGGKTSMS
jgi:hypothetical protein